MLKVTRYNLQAKTHKCFKVTVLNKISAANRN